VVSPQKKRVIGVRWRFDGTRRIEESRGVALFFNQKSDSLTIAREIIKNTGLFENLDILKEKKHQGSATPREVLKQVMALSTCNLVQTMKADFLDGEFSPKEQEEILRHYILESFRKQDLFSLGDKEETEALRLETLDIVDEFQSFWTDEDPQGSGPGPRYFCVKEVLRRLGGETDHDLHDALFELMYLQYQHYLKFFREHLNKN